jgi:hypothetical protein
VQSPNTSFVEIRLVVSGMKHADGHTDGKTETSSLCVHFMHLVQRTREKCKAAWKKSLLKCTVDIVTHFTDCRRAFLVSFMLEVFSSNSGWDIGYLDRKFCGLPQPLQANSVIASDNRQRCLPSRFLLNRHL